MTTIREAVEQATHNLTHMGQQNPRRDVQVLLGHVLNVERSILYAYPERQLTPAQAQQLHELVARRMQGEPVAYLIGHEEFYGLHLLINSHVLIPRPETELLVEEALKACRQHFDSGHIPIVADIGTGSGAIPIALATHEPRLPYLYATDISADALQVAQLNCQRHHVEQRIRFLQGDLLDPLPEAVDLITANLPYVGTDEMASLDPDVRLYEPHLALFSGPAGLDLIERLLANAQQSGTLKRGALLLLEIGYQQRVPLTTFMQEHWSQATVTFKKDFAGWDRVLQVST